MDGSDGAAGVSRPTLTKKRVRDHQAREGTSRDGEVEEENRVTKRPARANDGTATGGETATAMAASSSLLTKH